MAFLAYLKFLRGLFWFLFPWLVLVAGAAMLIPLDTHMPGVSYTGHLPPLSPKERALQANLRRHVQELAGRIGERNMHRMGALQAAAHYVQTQFRAAGLAVTSEAYEVNNDSVRNLVATIRGRARPREIVIVGAPYDSILGSPGAVLSLDRQLHCFCSQSKFERLIIRAGCGFPPTRTISVGRSGCPRLDHRRGLVRPLVLLGGRLRRRHGHGHSPLPLLPLP